MSNEGVDHTPVVFSSKERAALVARALGEAARRARFSTKRRRSLTSGGLRARRGERAFALIRMLSFVGIVAVPCLVFGVYIFVVASPQYAAESRFTVAGGMATALASPDPVGAVTGLPSEMIVQDTQIILNYLESRAIVDQLQQNIGLKRFFDNKYIDYFSRLSSTASIEEVVRYWKSHVEMKVSMPGGIVTFAVRGFTPQESVQITDAALDASEALVNRMNDQMRKDAVSVADAERQRAEDRLAVTRAKLERARNEEGMLNADSTSKGFDELLQKVKAEVLDLEQNYDSQRKFVDADAPQLVNLKTKIDAAKDQIAKLEAQITSQNATANASKARVLSGSMTRLDYAQLENDIAEKIYAAALASVEEAHIASEVKLMYVNRFVEPVAPEQSKYPKRLLLFSIVGLSCLVLWGLILLGARMAVNKLL